jgi:hypothetical protein
LLNQFFRGIFGSTKQKKRDDHPVRKTRKGRRNTAAKLPGMIGLRWCFRCSSGKSNGRDAAARDKYAACCQFEERRKLLALEDGRNETLSSS